MFHSFFSDESKQYAATTIAHIKRIITFFKQRNIMSAKLSTIWSNTDDCSEHYICATALYLISMLSQAFYVIIYRGISAPVCGREVLYLINSINKSFLFKLISTVQVTGTKVYDT